MRIVGGLFLAIVIVAAFAFSVPIFGINPDNITFGAYGDGTDSATGSGEQIDPDGNWFMYNEYAGGTQSFNIQVGNPDGGDNIIGTVQVTDNGNGIYTVTYDMNPGVTVHEEHLGISDSPDFTGAPGQDDNQDYGTSFSADGDFFIFAHFTVQY